MDLRSSHAQPAAFDAVAFIALAAFVGAGWFAREAGGAWLFVTALSVVGVMVYLYAAFIETRILRVTRYREPLVPEPRAWVTIAFVSDFHTGGFRPRAWFERIAREVQALHPDVIIGGGDFVTDRAESLKDLSSFASLSAPLGKFFVLGNHDYMDKPQEVRAGLIALGFADLTQQSVVVTRDGASLEVQGIDDHWRGNPRTLSRRSSSTPCVRIAHEPDAVLDLAEGDVDLVLSGHTHGGQVRIPGIGALYPIPAKLGRRVDRGRKVINGTRLIISTGLGEQDARFRLACPAEILLVEVGI